MNRRALRVLRYLLFFLAFPVLAFFLQKSESSVSSFISNKAIFLTLYSVFIAGPLWVAYGRLNNFDSSEGLKPSQSLAISNFAFSAKRFLLKYFSASVGLIVLVVFVVIVDGSFPALKSWPTAIGISAAIFFFVYAVISVGDVLLQIERTLRSVNVWRAEQKERNKQVADLRKARIDKKLIPDEKLLRYRFFIAEGVEKIPAAEQVVKSPEVGEEGAIAPDSPPG